MTKRIPETALAELLEHQQRAAASRFFLRIGQAGRASEDDNTTLPLFSFMEKAVFRPALPSLSQPGFHRRK